jgi:hypothetical protein
MQAVRIVDRSSIEHKGLGTIAKLVEHCLGRIVILELDDH